MTGNKEEMVFTASFYSHKVHFKIKFNCREVELQCNNISKL